MVNFIFKNPPMFEIGGLFFYFMNNGVKHNHAHSCEHYFHKINHSPFVLNATKGRDYSQPFGKIRSTAYFIRRRNHKKYGLQFRLTLFIISLHSQNYKYIVKICQIIQKSILYLCII